MRLIKVISGGQTGVDQAALAAASKEGFKTGGWAPNGWLTSDGPAKKLLKSYGLREHPSKGYKVRTWANVKLADATIRLCVNFKSPGELCTLNAIRHFKRPYLDIPLVGLQVTSRYECVRFLSNVRILNVAGNTQREIGVDIYEASYIMLRKIFRLYKETFA